MQFDATSNSGYQAASSSYNWTHTVGSGSNQILVVSVGLLNVVNSVTSITYNSVALTKLRSDVSVSGTVRTEIWYLLAPTTGANTVAVILNTASVSGASASSYDDVDPNNPIDAQNGTTGTTGAGGGSASVATTTVTNNAWVIDAIATPDTSITVGSGQTQRANITGAIGSAGQSDKGPNTPTGSVTMQWDNIAALTSWTMSTVALKPISDIVISDSAVTSESLNHYSDQVDTNERLLLVAVNLINKSDSSSLSENLALLISISISVSDTVITSENSNVALVDTFFVSDAITTTENVNLTISDDVTLSDSIITSESLSHYSDSIDINELVAILVYTDDDNINVFDDINVGESLAFSNGLAKVIDIADSISISESFNHYSDQVDTQEAITVLVLPPDENINISDTTTLSENINTTQVYTIGISDSITVTENRDILANNARNIAIVDNRLLDENGNFIFDEMGDYITDETAAEFITAAESSQVFSYTDKTILTSDIITISENIRLLIPTLLLVISDTTLLSDSVHIDINSQVVVNDTTSLTESIGRVLVGLPKVSDTTTLTEAINFFESLYNFSFADSATTSEVVQVYVAKIFEDTVEPLILVVSDVIALPIVVSSTIAIEVVVE